MRGGRSVDREPREGPGPSFWRCRPQARCRPCQLLDARPAAVRALFEAIVSRDPELVRVVGLLSQLFGDG